jgi:hypothetical protein
MMRCLVFLLILLLVPPAQPLRMLDVYIDVVRLHALFKDLGEPEKAQEYLDLADEMEFDVHGEISQILLGLDLAIAATLAQNNLAASVASYSDRLSPATNIDAIAAPAPDTPEVAPKYNTPPTTSTNAPTAAPVAMPAIAPVDSPDEDSAASVVVAGAVVVGGAVVNKAAA